MAPSIDLIHYVRILHSHSSALILTSIPPILSESSVEIRGHRVKIGLLRKYRGFYRGVY